MTDSYEVKITVGDATVEVSGAKEGVVEIVTALSAVLGGDAGSKPDLAPGRQPANADARSFFESKAPKSQNEGVVVAAYYLAELAPQSERSATIDVEKAQNVLRQAKFKLPKNLKSVLVNTQAAGYLDRVGSGEYRLNPVGWNLVEHTLGSE